MANRGFCPLALDPFPVMRHALPFCMDPGNGSDLNFGDLRGFMDSAETHNRDEKIVPQTTGSPEASDETSAETSGAALAFSPKNQTEKPNTNYGQDAQATGNLGQDVQATGIQLEQDAQDTQGFPISAESAPASSAPPMPTMPPPPPAEPLLFGDSADSGDFADSGSGNGHSRSSGAAAALHSLAWWLLIGWWWIVITRGGGWLLKALWNAVRGEPGSRPRRYSVREAASAFWHGTIRSPRAWAHGLIFLAAACAFWYVAIHYWVETIDDAYITFRYSDNFIHGRGPVYNPGERVEGCTALAWMAAIAVCIGAGFDAMFCAKVMGFLSCLAAMWGVAHFGGLLSRRRDVWNWIAVIPMALNVHFACWSMMGLETQFAVALLIWAYARFYQEMRDPRAWTLSPFLASLAAMTRFESLYYMTPLAAWAAVQVARGRLDWRRFFRWGLICAVFFGTFYAWKVWYYGDLLPNTFYAKVHGDYKARGIVHLREWYLGHGPGFLNLCLISFILCLLWPRPAMLLVLGPIILNVFYVYYVNGDWMQNFRFLQVIVPFISLAILMAIRHLQRLLPLWNVGSGNEKDRKDEGDGKNDLKDNKESHVLAPERRIAWLVVEIAVFAAWFWLVFFKGREILTGTKAGPLTPLWFAVAGGAGLLLLMRWAAILAGETPWSIARARTSPPPDASASSSAALEDDPAAALAQRRTLRHRRIAQFIGELLLYAAFALLFMGLLPPITNLLRAAVGESAASAGDLGIFDAVARLKADSFSISRNDILWLAAVALGIGWAFRLVSRGRWARSIARWPVYALLALGVLLSAQNQLRIATLYLWGTDPFLIPRNAHWARWSNVKRAYQSGFSLALPGVATWMLQHCQPNTTMFMSDLGYPAWLNMDVKLIDPDGLVTKEMANAPSVRGSMRSEKEIYRELADEWRLRQPLTPDEEKRVREQAEQTFSRLDDKEKARQPLEIIRNNLDQKARLRRPVPSAMEQNFRQQAYNMAQKALSDRNLKWLLAKPPEYCTLFIQHQTESGDSPGGFAYPQITDIYWHCPEFKDLYVEVGKFVKYGKSWNHFFRRKDVPADIDNAEVVRRLQEAIRRNPRVPHLYSEFVQAAKKASVPYDDKMKALIMRGADLFRGNVPFLNDLADIAYRQNDTDTAIKVWRISLEASPSQEWLYRHLSDYLEKNGRRDEAIKVAEQGLKFADNPWPHYNLAWLYDRAGRYPDAERSLLEAAKLTKDRDSRPYEDLGALHDRHNDKRKAIEAFQKALEINPSRSHLKNVIRELEDQLKTQPQSAPAPTPTATPASATKAKPAGS